MDKKNEFTLDNKQIIDALMERISALRDEMCVMKARMHHYNINCTHPESQDAYVDAMITLENDQKIERALVMACLALEGRL